jgi:asparagine synthase (glutamine-hydrolysing)
VSGVFGILDLDRSIALEKQLIEMGQVMTHHDWQVVETYADEEIGLGRVGIGIFNKQVQPVWNADRTAAICMAGEFYDTDRLKRELMGDRSDEALALHLYSQQGEDFVKNIRGAFVMAIWDAHARLLRIISDHFGLYPTYIAQVNKRLIFAPEVKAILTDPDVDRSLRDDSIAEYVRFQRLLGVKTFFTGVEVLPPASILTYDLREGRCAIRTYWSIQETPLLPASMTFDEAVDEGARLLRQAIARMSAGHERLGVYLSGGIDSRCIVGMIPQRAGDVHTFTFGQPDSRDAYYGDWIARAAGTQHHYHAYHNGDWISQYAGLHIDLTEGFQPWLHMHGISMLPEVRAHVDVNLSGLGDLIWEAEDFFPRAIVRAPDDIAYHEGLFTCYNQKYSWPGINEAEERQLYDEAFYPRVRGLAFASLMKESEAFSGLPYLQRLRAFNNVNHFTRHLLYHVVYGRSHVEYRLPFFDLDLHTFCYSLPFEPGHDRDLQLAIIARELPDMARIPRASNELPITYQNQGLTLHRAVNKMKRMVNQYVKPIFPERSSLYADYESWLRTDLREWAESILFDEGARSRGIFRPEALRSLMNRHLSGVEQWTIGKIAPLITFEMMLRQLSALIAITAAVAAGAPPDEALSLAW